MKRLVLRTFEDSSRRIPSAHKKRHRRSDAFVRVCFLIAKYFSFTARMQAGEQRSLLR